MTNNKKPALYVAFGGIFLSVLLRYIFGRKKKYPPGPLPLPLLGNLLTAPQNGTQIFDFFNKQMVHYGDIICIWIGQQPVIAIGSMHYAKELFIKNAEFTSERPSQCYLIKSAQLSSGNSLLLGEHKRGQWKNVRKFCAHAFRGFGLASSQMEEKVFMELEAMNSTIQDFGNEPFSPQDVIFTSVANIIANVCYSERFDVKNLSYDVLQAVKYVYETEPLILRQCNYVPLLRLFPQGETLTKLLHSYRYIKDYMKLKISDHEESFDPNCLRDLVDHFIASQRQKTKDNLTVEDILSLIVDIFIAGADTVASTLEWILLFCIKFPEKQKLCQIEIDRVLGESRRPQLKDRPKLVYIEAFLMESMRLSTVAPSIIPHLATESFVADGFDIPKGAQLFINLFKIHRNPMEYYRPEEFIPERWLDGSGKLRRFENFMPFGIGSRSCIGEILAKSELFIFVTGLLQRFTFEKESEHTVLSLEATVNLVRKPKSYNLRATIR